MVWGAAPLASLIVSASAMSLLRIEARKRGPIVEACHQRMVNISPLPDFFLLLISRT